LKIAHRAQLLQEIENHPFTEQQASFAGVKNNLILAPVRVDQNDYAGTCQAKLLWAECFCVLFKSGCSPRYDYKAKLMNFT